MRERLPHTRASQKSHLHIINVGGLVVELGNGALRALSKVLDKEARLSERHLHLEQLHVGQAHDATLGPAPLKTYQGVSKCR